MARVLVIGAGGVATVACHKIAQNPDVFTDVMIASRTKAKCDKIVEAIGNPNIKTAQATGRLYHRRQRTHQRNDLQAYVGAHWQNGRSARSYPSRVQAHIHHIGGVIRYGYQNAAGDCRAFGCAHDDGAVCTRARRKGE